MSINVPMHGAENVVKADVAVIGGVRAEATVGEGVSVSATVGSTVVSADEYDGEYVSKPGIREQSYGTAGKIMKENFTVLEIPTHAAPNDYGTTFTIGV